MLLVLFSSFFLGGGLGLRQPAGPCIAQLYHAVEEIYRSVYMLLELSRGMRF